MKNTTTADKYLVFNSTDGFFASPDEMTKEEAEQFVKDFPKRYEFQGYYKDSSGQRIHPDDVVLKVVQSNKIQEEMKNLLDETDSRRKELINAREERLEKNKGNRRSR